MSKLGKKAILLKQGVTIKQEGQKLTVTGVLGETCLTLPSRIKLEILPQGIKVNREGDDKKIRSEHGTFVRLITNAIEGVSGGFSKVLEIVGTGFRAQMEGADLVMALGFSHQVRFPTPEGIKIEVLENTKIKVSGVDKEKVGTIADKIKKIKQPDSYKGKGIRYLGQKLKLKPGKAAAKASTAGGK